MKILTKARSGLFFLLHMMCTVPISSSSDTINTAQVIRDGDTIVSSAQNFELGFFSPVSSDNRYVGVWFKNITTRTVVWVANRNSPLRNTSSGVLTVNPTGNLVILDETNTTIWSSNASRTAKNPMAKLLDSGNLVIYEEDAKDYYMWESFNHPTDTLINGMDFGWNIVPEKLTYLSSWKTAEDPSTGDFTLSMDNTGYPQLVIKRGDALQFRLGPFNGLSFSGTPNRDLNEMVNLTVNSSAVIFSGFNVQSSVFMFTLSPTGVGEFLTWSKSWLVLYKFPADICDDYAACGAQGICNNQNVPLCGCLDRFVPRDSKDWASSDWSGGCVRRTPLNCQNDVFLKYSGMKMPDARLTSHDASLRLEECEGVCLRNCSCMAYSTLNVSNGGSGCLMWFGDLVDIRVVPGEDDQNIFIRLAASELGSKWMRQTTHIAILASLAGLFLLGLIGTLSLFIWKRKEDGKLRKEDISDEDTELPMYDMAEVAKATDDFSISSKLGEGGFGPVYKGTMKDGKEIAVKRLSETSSQGLEEFKNEILCIAKLQHRNLVKLLGWCIQGEAKMLIYEYMPNKSLDLLLFNEAESRRLDWPKRLHIINGIAKGLLYLHQDSRWRIIHRDLKASNVLLDKELNPKISDFGMARIFGGNETEGNTLRVVGTYGYMSPEYAVEGFFSLKSDVYSFGVLVLEIVSGRTNRGFRHDDHHHNLVGHAWILYKENRSLDLVRDPNIGNSVYLYELVRSIRVALLCVQQRPEDRPSMASVVLMLGSRGVLPEAKEPGFFMERRGVGHQTCSNECTNTLKEGR